MHDGECAVGRYGLLLTRTHRCQLVRFPFALLRGCIFKPTTSLTPLVPVQLLFGFDLFLDPVHPHKRDRLPLFPHRAPGPSNG